MIAIRTAVLVIFFASAGAVLHRAFNSGALFPGFLLISGLSIGVMLALLVFFGFRYCTGKFVLPLRAEFQELGVQVNSWVGLSGCVILAGMFLVFSYNALETGPPMRVLEAEVISNGSRARAPISLYFVVELNGKYKPPNELKLKIMGRLASMTYPEHKPSELSDLKAGDTVKVYYEAGGMGVPMVTRVSTDES